MISKTTLKPGYYIDGFNELFIIYNDLSVDLYGLDGWIHYSKRQFLSNVNSELLEFICDLDSPEFQTDWANFNFKMCVMVMNGGR